MPARPAWRWRKRAACALLAGMWAAGCGYDRWPDPETVYPYVYTPEEDLEPWADVRWETETWDPATDLDRVAQYLLKAENHRPGAPEESLVHFEQMRAQIPPLGSGIRLSLVGDIMWVGSNWSAFSAPVAHLLDGDLRAGNLETPTSPAHPTGPGELGLYAFNAPTSMLDGLPFDLLQLNNNHSLDAGNEGLEATLDEVQQRGILPLGVDTQTSVRVGDLEVAFLGYTWGINVRDVSPARELFIVPFGHLDEPLDLDQTVEAIRSARDGADAVVVMLHWGFEYEYYPDPHFMQIARRLIAAGADVVVGSGPHVVQPPELCHVNRPPMRPGIGTCSVRAENSEERTAAILYSLGNFATRMPTLPAQVGIVATVSLDPDVSGLGWAAVASIDGTGGREVVALDSLVGEPTFDEESARLDTHLGEAWRRP